MKKQMRVTVNDTKHDGLYIVCVVLDGHEFGKRTTSLDQAMSTAKDAARMLGLHEYALMGKSVTV